MKLRVPLVYNLKQNKMFMNSFSKSSKLVFLDKICKKICLWSLGEKRQPKTPVKRYLFKLAVYGISVARFWKYISLFLHSVGFEKMDDLPFLSQSC